MFESFVANQNFWELPSGFGSETIHPLNTSKKLNVCVRFSRSNWFSDLGSGKSKGRTYFFLKKTILFFIAKLKFFWAIKIQGNDFFFQVEIP